MILQKALPAAADCGGGNTGRKDSILYNRQLGGRNEAYKKMDDLVAVFICFIYGLDTCYVNDDVV